MLLLGQIPVWTEAPVWTGAPALNRITGAPAEALTRAGACSCSCRSAKMPLRSNTAIISRITEAQSVYTHYFHLTRNHAELETAMASFVLVRFVFPFNSTLDRRRPVHRVDPIIVTCQRPQQQQQRRAARGGLDYRINNAITPLIRHNIRTELPS